MLRIGTEFAIFVHAFLAGILAAGVYLSLRVLRRLIPHALWALNLEDVCYWLATAVYLFVQIYQTSDGQIRWFQVLGVVFGGGFLGGCALLAGRLAGKIGSKFCKKSEKTLAEQGKNV